MHPGAIDSHTIVGGGVGGCLVPTLLELRAVSQGDVPCLFRKGKEPMLDWRWREERDGGGGINRWGGISGTCGVSIFLVGCWTVSITGACTSEGGFLSSVVSSGPLSCFSLFPAIARKAALLGCSISVGSGSRVAVIKLKSHQELCSVQDSRKQQQLGFKRFLWVETQPVHLYNLHRGWTHTLSSAHFVCFVVKYTTGR